MWRLVGMLGLGVIAAAPGQGTPPRYTAEMLACASYRESVRSDIRGEAGAIVRQERAGRDGLLMVRTVAGDSGLELTAWYDSLRIWRDSPEGRDLPDTEGLLGGRWRGRLSPAGRTRLDQAPFVPDDVAEIADVRGVMADFFPVLDPRPGAELSWRRTGTANHLTRYTWTAKFRADTSGTVDDSLVVPMERHFQEESSLEWDAQRGPVRWERTITVTGRIQALGAIKRGMRSTVIQRINVERTENNSCP
jgi:hypothetical protein